MEVTSISNLGLVALLFGACATLEPSLAQDANSIVPREGLAIANVVSRRRGGIDSYDPIETMMIRGELENFQPQPDDPLTLNNGDMVRWKTVELDENGSADRQALGRGGYLYVTVHSETDRVMILQAGSHGGLYFNGVPHTANVYGYAYYHLPVRLQKGDNRLLLRSGRRNVQAKLYSPPAPSFLLEGDKTLPDLVFDELADTWGAVIVVNSSTTVTTDLALAVHGDQLNRVVTPLPSIPPLSIRKVGFRIQATLYAVLGLLMTAAIVYRWRDALWHTTNEIEVPTSQPSP